MNEMLLRLGDVLKIAYIFLFLLFDRAGEEVSGVGCHASSVAWLVKNIGMKYDR